MDAVLECCDYCYKSSAEVSGLKFRIDPFLEEIAGREVWKWLCNGCYKILCQEI